MLGAAVIHASINVPHLHQDLLVLQVRPALLDAVTLVMCFGVVAMFAFAVLVLSNAPNVSSPQSMRTMSIIAAVYVTFGLIGYMSLSRTPHMLGRLFIGALLALGTRTRGPTTIS